MSTTASPTVLTVEAAHFPETCDKDSKGTEAAIVAVLISIGEKKTARLVFCGHHFDNRSPQLNALILATHDQRDFGLFSDERPS